VRADLDPERADTHAQTTLRVRHGVQAHSPSAWWSQLAMSSPSQTYHRSRMTTVSDAAAALSFNIAGVSLLACGVTVIGLR